MFTFGVLLTKEVTEMVVVRIVHRFASKYVMIATFCAAESKNVLKLNNRGVCSVNKLNMPSSQSSCSLMDKVLDL